MAGINRMVGTPWHVERFEREEGDARRHRSRCKYYGGKPDGHCRFFNGRCHGTAHCRYYDETAERKESTMPKGRFVGVREIPKSAFTGIQLIQMKDIELNSKFENKQPKKNKIDDCIKYYREHGELDKPVVISCSGSKYRLEDKYLRYVAAKQLCLKEIPAEMGAIEELKQRDKLRSVGSLVWIKKSDEVGEVVDATMKKTKIRTDSGKVSTFDILKCLETGAIRPL